MFEKSARLQAHTALKKYFFFLFFLFLHMYAVAQKSDTTGVSALFNEAKELAMQKQFEEAILRYRQADSLYASVGDSRGHISCLINKAKCLNKLERLDEATEVLRDAVAYAQSVHQPTLNNLMIEAYVHLSETLKQQEAYEESHLVALEGIQIILAGRPVDYRSLENLYGDISYGFWARSRVEPALIYSKKALEAGELGNIDMESKIFHYDNLATDYAMVGNLDTAFYYREKVLSWLDTLKQRPKNFKVPLFYINCSGDFSAKGDLDRALQYAREAAILGEKDYKEYPRLIAYAYYNLASSAYSAGSKQESLTYYSRTLALVDSLWKQPMQVRAAIHRDLGTYWYQEGDSLRAYKHWEKAMKEEETIGNTSGVAGIHHLMAELMAQRGNFSKALAYIEKSIQIESQIQHKGYVPIARHYGLAAGYLNQLGRYEEALSHTEKAIRLQCGSGNCFQDAAHPPRPGETGSIEYLAYNLMQKGKALMGQWRAAPQAFNLLESAWETVEQAMRVVAFFRKHYQKSGTENYQWLQETRDVYSLAIEIARQRAEAQKDNSFLQTAFQIADQSRAILLTESARNADARHFAGVPPELLAQEQHFRGLIALYEGKAQEGDEQERPADKHYRDSVLFNLRRSQERLVEKIEHEYPQYYNLRYDNRPLDVARLCQQLAPDAALIEYFVNASEKTLYIFVADRAHGVRLQTQAWDEKANKQVLQIHQRAQSVLLQRKEEREQFVSESHALYQQLINPVMPFLEGKKQLIIVADGDLHYLPFDLLVENAAPKPFNQSPFLIRRYNISYQYAATLYLRNAAHRRQNAQAQQELLAFAPVFGVESAPQAISMRNRNIVDTTLRAADGGGQYFQPLPWSEQEAYAIAALFGQQQSTLLLRQEADEANLKAELKKNYRMIHLSTHSFANKSRPKFSGIACTQPQEDASHEEDGILYANEIYNLPITAELVVLSSCESGVGKSGGGEGLLGLNRAFVYAGAPNVLYSLWKVNDKVTSELMIEFYKQMSAGKSYSAALRAAKLKILENPATASPNLWSGFLLMGR